MPTLQTLLRTWRRTRYTLQPQRRGLSYVLAVFLTVAFVTPIFPQATLRDVTGVVAQRQQSCNGVYHLVRAGQTIYAVAAAYGTTAYRIAVCNGLSSYTLYVGQSILVPYRRQ